MRCRDISRERFHALASESVDAERQIGDIETLTGRNKDGGTTILVRDAPRCRAAVGAATLFDALLPHGMSDEGQNR